MLTMEIFSFAVENKKVPLQFEDSEDTKTYNVLWTELLVPGTEVPYESYEDLQPKTEVLAPWESGDGIIQFARATVLSPKKGISCLLCLS